MLQNMYTHQDVSKEEKIFSFLIVLMVLFHVYHPPSISISFGEMLMFACVPLYFKRDMEFPYYKHELGFLIFFCYMAISSMMMGVVFDAPLSKYFSIARAGFYWVLIFYFGKNLFSRVIFEKWMVVFSVVLSFFILVQYVVYILTGYFIPGLLAGLPINNGGESGSALYEHYLYLAGALGYVRPHGFLAEPAHASQFLFISIITLICCKNILFKKKILLLLLFSAAVVATQSTTGIVLLCLAWILFLSIEKRLSACRIPFVLLFVAVAIYVLFSGFGSKLSSIERVVNIVNGADIDGSSNVRLNNGMDLFSNLPFAFKIFGTGAGLSEYAFSSFGIKDANSYMNALAGIFFSTGIIGGVIWIFSLVIMFVMSGLLGKSLVVGFFIMTLGCSIYCQPQMVWFFLLILADIKEKNGRYPRIKL